MIGMHRPVDSDGTFEKDSAALRTVLPSLTYVEGHTIGAVARCFAEPTKLLIEIAEDKSLPPDVRSNATRGLGSVSGIGSYSATMPSLLRASEDQEPAVRCAAVRALGDISGLRASMIPPLEIDPTAQSLVPIFVKRLGDPDHLVREAAEVALGNCRWAAADSVSEIVAEVQRSGLYWGKFYGVEALGLIGSDDTVVVECLRGVRSNRSYNQNLRRAAEKSLRQIAEVQQWSWLRSLIV